jgi:hypothetical protein
VGVGEHRNRFPHHKRDIVGQLILVIPRHDGESGWIIDVVHIYLRHRHAVVVARRSRAVLLLLLIHGVGITYAIGAA